MDVRGHLAEAFFERLRDDGVEFRVLADAQQVVVARGALAGMPRRVARFAQDLDLNLVRLSRSEPQAWQFLLAWSDELGQPSFLSLELHADYYRGGRRFMRAEELLTGAPDALFVHGLLDAVERQCLDDERTAALHALWHDDPRGAIERVGRFWRNRADIRLLAQAAKHDAWQPLRAALPRLRRRLRRTVWPDALALAACWSARLRRLLQRDGARVAFIGMDNPQLRERVARDLAPAGITVVGGEDSWRAEVGVTADAPPAGRHRFEELVLVDRAQALPAAAASVERALLRWLECRVERRHPDVMVGGNPLSARLLQLACRHDVPLAAGLLRAVLNSDIACRLRTPILMPHPYGIVIHRNAVIGSRVTVMHQVTIGSRSPSDPDAPIIEDNVYLGPGARVLGAVRVGRGATVGANAVVTRDVPSHCTVVGANRILGAGAVAPERQRETEIVVNT